MISRWKWMLKQTFKKLWFRATLFAIVAIITALLSILFKSMIPESVSVKVGAEIPVSADIHGLRTMNSRKERLQFIRKRLAMLNMLIW